MVVYLFGVAAVSFGAGDINGAGSGLATVSQIGPVATVFVLSGAAATAMCADLGARTIREEIDAMRVLGINPVHRLVVPRVVALIITGNLINGLVIISGTVRRLCLHYLRFERQSRCLRDERDAADQPSHGGGQLCQSLNFWDARRLDRLL